MSRSAQFKRLLALDLASFRKQPHQGASLVEQLGSVRQVRLLRGSRNRKLKIEALEQRAMLAASELVLNIVLPVSVGKMETSTIVWQGEKRSVSAGHWIVAMDGLPASPLLQLAAANKELKQLGSGPAVKMVSSLGGRGSLLIQTAPTVNYAELKASLSSLPGFRYLEPDFTIFVYDIFSFNILFYSCYFLINNRFSMPDFFIANKQN